MTSDLSSSPSRGLAVDAGKRAVFLSPHPDDAIWSCGGRIAALVEVRIPVLIVTCFDGDGPATPHSEPSPRRAASRPILRRSEDLLATGELGARLISLGFSEATLRIGESGAYYPNLQALFGEPVDADRSLVAPLTQAIRKCLRAGDHLHVPVASGSHVDHALVRRAIDAIPSAWPRHYYEEFPYASFTPPEGATPSLVPVAFEPWLRASLRYRSQVLAIFGGAGRFREALTGWARDRGNLIAEPFGERYWSASAREM